MSEVFDRLLITAPNGGGIFFVHNGRLHQLDSMDTTGLAISGRRVVRALQPNVAVLYEGNPLEIGPADIMFGDIHDVLVDGDFIYLVSTESNEIVKLDVAGFELDRWTLPGEADSWHINCLAKWRDRIVFSAFGEFDRHRQYKGATRGSGFVQDLVSGERLITGLSQPHSLVPNGERLLLANSEEEEIREYDAGGNLLRSMRLGGYVRGVCIAESHLYVGLSRSRNLPSADLQTATVIALDAVEWNELSRIQLPVHEIYAIQGVDVVEVPRVLAQIAAHAHKTSNMQLAANVDRLTRIERDLQRSRQEHSEALAALENIGWEKARDALMSELGRIDETLSSASKNAALSLDLLHILHESSISKDHLHEIRVELSERAEEVGQLRGQLTARMEETSLLRAALDESAAQVSHLQMEVGRRVEEVRALRADLDVRVVEMGLLQSEISRDGNEIKRLLSELDIQVQRSDSIERASQQEQERLQERILDLEKEALYLRHERESVEVFREALREELDAAYASNSWRLTSPLRFARRLLTGQYKLSVGEAVKATWVIISSPKRTLRFLSRIPKLGIRNSLEKATDFYSRGGKLVIGNDVPLCTVMPEQESHVPVPLVFARNQKPSVIVLTTQHCYYIAELMVDALAKHRIFSEIIFEKPQKGYRNLPHIVICPQMFDSLPDMYVSMQMEQSVSSRWFTDRYFRTLENSYAILDYSLKNIEFLKHHGLSARQINYLPVGWLDRGLSIDEVDRRICKYDVVFYGDPNNERRQAYLNALRERFNVLVASEVFGEELKQVLLSCKVIVNIHYYEDALLETTRLWECLSHGLVVVSEKSSDQEEHQELERYVDFVEVGDVSGMADRVGYWLADDAARRTRQQHIIEEMPVRLDRFDYYFQRFLLATDNIDFEEFWEVVGYRKQLSGNKVCLSLPEYGERRTIFEAQPASAEFEVFDGLRHGISWIGAGLSYKYIMRLAKQQSLAQITICEDDVEFLAGFDARFHEIEHCLREHSSEWDIFSGIMADVHPEMVISGVTRMAGNDLYHVDKMVSMVFNTYNSSVYNLLCEWDDRNRFVSVNAIDRYLEHRGLKVLLRFPFLVGHVEDANSTIWGFNNTQYSEMIDKSSRVFGEKVEKFSLGSSGARSRCKDFGSAG